METADLIGLASTVQSTVQVWAGFVGPIFGLVGFLIITVSALRVQARERLARGAEERASIYNVVNLRWLSHPPDSIPASTVRDRSDWYHHEAREHEREAGEHRLAGFRIEQRALYVGAGLILIGFALQAVAGWPR